MLVGAAYIESLKVFSNHSDTLQVVETSGANEAGMHRVSLSRWAKDHAAKPSHGQLSEHSAGIPSLAQK